MAPVAAAAQQPPPTRPDRQPPPRRAADANVQREQASQRARWRAPQAPDDDALGDNSPCRWLCRQLGRVVLGALGVILVIFWLLLGQLLSLQTLAPPALLSVLAWAGVGGLYVQLLSITPCGLREALHRELSRGYVGFESLLDAMVFSPSPRSWPRFKWEVGRIVDHHEATALRVAPGTRCHAAAHRRRGEHGDDAGVSRPAMQG